jgi:hypothetical protein
MTPWKHILDKISDYCWVWGHITWGPNYLGGEGKENDGSRPVQAKLGRNPI